MEPDPPPYVIHCPRCGDVMVEHGRDYINGTLCESTDECRGCGFCRSYSYGQWQEHEVDVTGGDLMATKLIGMHDDANKDDYFKLHLSMCSVVETVRRMNFGEHRFLSELVRQRKADEQYKPASEFKKNTDALEALLNDGFD